MISFVMDPPLPAGMKYGDTEKTRLFGLRRIVMHRIFAGKRSPAVIGRTAGAQRVVKILSMPRFVLIVILIASAFHLAAQPATRGGALPPPLPLFPADNWWNSDVSAAPVDPNSAAFIAFIGATRGGMHPDFGGDSGDPSSPIYGMPYLTVPASH